MQFMTGNIQVNIYNYFLKSFPKYVAVPRLTQLNLLVLMLIINDLYVGNSKYKSEITI